MVEQTGGGIHTVVNAPAGAFLVLSVGMRVLAIFTVVTLSKRELTRRWLVRQESHVKVIK